MRLKNSAIVLIAVSLEPSMKETDEYLKMKLKKQWRTTTLNYNLVLLEMEGMVVLTDDGYKVTKDGETKIYCRGQDLAIPL